MSDQIDSQEDIWNNRAEGLDELAQRLEALEQWRGHTALHFAHPVQGQLHRSG